MRNTNNLHKMGGGKNVISIDCCHLLLLYPKRSEHAFHPISDSLFFCASANIVGIVRIQ